MPLLSINDIDFAFPGRQVFHHASLTVSSYKITGILGGNGAGKTTLFDLICGIHLPLSGAVQRRTDDLLYLSQIISTPAVLTMRDIATLIISLTCQHDRIITHLQNTLSRWDLNASNRYSILLPKKASLCSYGEKRWFFTLTLLALEPELIILDEPTAGVDVENRHSIWNCLKRCSQEGTGVIVSSHDIGEIATNCDEFYMISRRQFIHFNSGIQFQEYFDAPCLEGAFINAIRQ